MNPLLDSRQLRAFTVLAQEGSFTQAGRTLHLTQSAVSHAIRSLEEELGCQLFLRQGRRVLLTPHGRELLRHAEVVQRKMMEARASLGALDRNPRGQLRIGCTPSASQYILPTVLREFKDSFPLYGIMVVPGETPQIQELLENGAVDLGISLKPRDSSHLDCAPLFEDELVFLVSALHPWRQQPPKPRDLAGTTYIISSRGGYTFALANDYFLKLGVRPRSFIELGSTEAIKELVKLGLGVALLASWTARAEIEQGSLAAVPLVKGRVRRQWVVSNLKDKPMTLAESTFIGLCREVGGGFMRPVSGIA